MRPRIRAEVSTTRTEYGTVLLDERSSQFWQLSPTAGLVVEAIQAGEGLDGAVRRLTSSYQVSAEVAERDVVALVRRLRDLGVVLT